MLGIQVIKYLNNNLYLGEKKYLATKFNNKCFIICAILIIE